MTTDPLAQWEGIFPYDALAAVGITPRSSMREVRDASFDLMAKGRMTPEARRAWDELRLVVTRLVVDFFLYEVDLAEELPQACEQLRRALLPEREERDLSQLLSLESELERMPADVQKVVLTPPAAAQLEEFDQLSPSELWDGLIQFDR